MIKNWMAIIELAGQMNLIESIKFANKLKLLCMRSILIVVCVFFLLFSLSLLCCPLICVFYSEHFAFLDDFVKHFSHWPRVTNYTTLCSPAKCIHICNFFHASQNHRFSSHQYYSICGWKFSIANFCVGFSSIRLNTSPRVPIYSINYDSLIG